MEIRENTMNPDFKSYLEQHRQEIMDFLKNLVEINSFSGNPSGVNRVGKMLADFLNPMRVEQTVHERKEIGSHYRFTSPSAQGGAKLLFLVHLDTVFPEDCGFTQFRVDGDKAFGPGVIDMKGGIVVLCFALKMIHDLCLNHPFEYWEESGDCYDYYLEILDEEFYSVVDITKNSNNTFELEAVDTEGGMEFMLIMTISVSGNNLEMSYTYYEDGILNETYSEYWAKVSMDVDSLPICDY